MNHRSGRRCTCVPTDAGSREQTETETNSKRAARRTRTDRDAFFLFCRALRAPRAPARAPPTPPALPGAPASAPRFASRGRRRAARLALRAFRARGRGGARPPSVRPLARAPRGEGPALETAGARAPRAAVSLCASPGLKAGGKRPENSRSAVALSGPAPPQRVRRVQSDVNMDPDEMMHPKCDGPNLYPARHATAVTARGSRRRGGRGGSDFGHTPGPRGPRGTRPRRSARAMAYVIEARGEELALRGGPRRVALKDGRATPRAAENRLGVVHAMLDVIADQDKCEGGGRAARARAMEHSPALPASSQRAAGPHRAPRASPPRASPRVTHPQTPRTASSTLRASEHTT